MLVLKNDKYMKIFLPLAFRTTSLFYLQQGGYVLIKMKPDFAV
jgi:hypothetical protein